MILSVGYADSFLLLEGDAEKRAESRISAVAHPKTSLLKVGHHGPREGDNAGVDGLRPAGV